MQRIVIVAMIAGAAYALITAGAAPRVSEADRAYAQCKRIAGTVPLYQCLAMAGGR